GRFAQSQKVISTPRRFEIRKWPGAAALRGEICHAGENQKRGRDEIVRAAARLSSTRAVAVLGIMNYDLRLTNPYHAETAEIMKTETKLQAPNSKLQRNTKSQAPKSRHRRLLDFEVWS